MASPSLLPRAGEEPLEMRTGSSRHRGASPCGAALGLPAVRSALAGELRREHKGEGSSESPQSWADQRQRVLGSRRGTAYRGQVDPAGAVGEGPAPPAAALWEETMVRVAEDEDDEDGKRGGDIWGRRMMWLRRTDGSLRGGVDARGSPPTGVVCETEMDLACLLMEDHVDDLEELSDERLRRLPVAALKARSLHQVAAAEKAGTVVLLPRSVSANAGTTGSTSFCFEEETAGKEGNSRVGVRQRGSEPRKLERAKAMSFHDGRLSMDAAKPLKEMESLRDKRTQFLGSRLGTVVRPVTKDQGEKGSEGRPTTDAGACSNSSRVPKQRATRAFQRHASASAAPRDGRHASASRTQTDRAAQGPGQARTFQRISSDRTPLKKKAEITYQPTRFEDSRACLEGKQNIYERRQQILGSRLGSRFVCIEDLKAGKIEPSRLVYGSYSLKERQPAPRTTKKSTSTISERPCVSQATRKDNNAAARRDVKDSVPVHYQ